MSDNRSLTDTPVIRVVNLSKIYSMGKTRVQALRGVSLDIRRGEFVAIMGPSGSGKSTFMNLLGCLDTPSGGEYFLNNHLVSKLSPDALADIRNRMIGFVFQGFNLLSRSSALQNVELPLLYSGQSAAERKHRAKRSLELVGLGNRLQHHPNELSGGQQQRVAIARALVNRPAIVMADEPTGNLDSKTSLEIMALLQSLNQQGLTVVLVTHEPDIANYASRHIHFKDGSIVQEANNQLPRTAIVDLRHKGGQV